MYVEVLATIGGVINSSTLKLKIIAIGKTQKGFIEDGVNIYASRLKKYLKVELQTIPDIKAAKNLTADVLMKREEELIRAELGEITDFYVLDERGKEYTSEGLASFFERQMVAGKKEVALIIGGAYGVSDALKTSATGLLSLSKLTFSHQMVRVFLMEQVYRAMTIIRGEPYHHS